MCFSTRHVLVAGINMVPASFCSKIKFSLCYGRHAIVKSPLSAMQLEPPRLRWSYGLEATANHVGHMELCIRQIS
jgi:hypothetical protein